MVHFKFFNGSFAHSIASWYSNPQVMGSNLKKSKNFKKRFNIVVHIPGNQESEDDILLKLIFSVELGISSQT
jgi:hypothetical protein